MFCTALNPARSKAINLVQRVASESHIIGDIIFNAFTNQTLENIVQFLLDCSCLPEVIVLEQGANSFLEALASLEVGMSLSLSGF